MSDTGEGDRIRAMLGPLASLAASSEILLGPGDDAAVVRPGEGQSVVLSTDMSVEGVHFRREWFTWETIGYRAVASALSDLAAMAARPLGVLISVALPPELDPSVHEQLAVGMADCLRVTGGTLLGGDTSRSEGGVVIDVTVVGSSPGPVTRAGALPGQDVWVTGRLGSAAAAVAALESGLEPGSGDRARLERPEPRILEAAWLVERTGITAAIDLSDGLATDARHLAEASGVGLEIGAASVPLAASLESWSDGAAALSIAIGGGEDYELLVTAAGVLEDVRSDFESRFGLELTRIGEVVKGSAVRWLGRGGERIEPPARSGFDHFIGRG